MMTLYTIAIMPYEDQPKLSTLQAMINDVSNSTVPFDLFPSKFAVVDAFLAIYLIYIGYVLVQEIYQLIKRPPALSQFFNPVGNFYYRALLILYGGFTLASYPAYYANSLAMHVPQTIGLILGWAFLMFFTRGVKGFSYFTVIMQTAFEDIARFVVVYLVILIPFSAAMTIIFQFSDMTEFNTFWNSLLSMFKLTLGLLETDFSQGSHYPGLANTLYIAFLAVAYILLFVEYGDCIALCTCSQVSANRQSQWYLQKLGIILLIECRLLPATRSYPGQSKKFRVRQVAGQEKSCVPESFDLQAFPFYLRDMDSATQTRTYLTVTKIIEHHLSSCTDEHCPDQTFVDECGCKWKLIAACNPSDPLDHRIVPDVSQLQQTSDLPPIHS